MFFVVSISNNHKLLKILKCEGSFLNNEKEVWFHFFKHHLILMCPNTTKDNSNFFHWLFKKFTMGFIVFINRFKPGKEISFMKESRIIIFNTLPNSLDKRTKFKNMINIFATYIIKTACECNFYPSSD